MMRRDSTKDDKTSLKSPPDFQMTGVTSMNMTFLSMLEKLIGTVDQPIVSKINLEHDWMAYRMLEHSIETCDIDSIHVMCQRLKKIEGWQPHAELFLRLVQKLKIESEKDLSELKKSDGPLSKMTLDQQAINIMADSDCVSTYQDQSFSSFPKVSLVFALICVVVVESFVLSLLLATTILSPIFFETKDPN